MHTTDFDARTEFARGLFDLGRYLLDHPDVPVPRQLTVAYFPPGTDEEERRDVDWIAAVIGRPAAERDGHGHYVTGLEFGPIRYEAVAIPDAYLQEFQKINHIGAGNGQPGTAAAA